MKRKNPPLHVSQAVLASVRAAPSLPVHPAAVAWGDDEGRQRLSIRTPAKIVRSPPGTASRASHASESRPLLPDRTLLQGPMHLSEGQSTRAGAGTAASPGSQTRVPGTLGRESHALAGAPGHGSPDKGNLGAHGWGTVVLMIVRGGRRYCSCSWSAPGALRGASCSWAGATRQGRSLVIRYARKLREGGAPHAMQPTGYSRTQPQR